MGRLCSIQLYAYKSIAAFMRYGLIGGGGGYMKRQIKLVAAILFVILFSSARPSSADEAIEWQIENIYKIQTSVNQISRDLDILRIESKFSEKRIEDASFAVDRMTLLIGVVGIIIGIVGIGIPVFVGFRVNKEASSYAKAAIDNTVGKAIADIEEKLRTSIVTLSEAGGAELLKLTKLREEGEKELDKLKKTTEDFSQIPVEVQENANTLDLPNGNLVEIPPSSTLKTYAEWRDIYTSAADKKDYLTVIEVCGRALDVADNDQQRVSTLYQRAHSFHELKEYQRAISEYEKVLSISNSADNAEINSWIIKSYIGLAISLEAADNTPAAIERLAEAADRFDHANDREQRDLSALAISNLSVLYRKIGDNENSIILTEKLLNNYAPNESTLVSWLILQARIRKGRILRNRKKYIESVAQIEIALELARGSTSEAWRGQLSEAYLLKTFSLHDLNQYTAIIECTSEMFEIFKDDKSTEILERLSTALYFKARAYDELGKTEEELETYDFLINRYDDSTNPTIMENVASALQMKMYTLSIAKREDEARGIADLIMQRYKKSKNKHIKSIIKSVQEWIDRHPK
jgi:tetratricopeptide (TPR) repeat protein